MSGSLGPDDLVLCAGTIPSASFAERVEAAVAGGFRGLSLFLSDVDRALEGGAKGSDLRALLADHGLRVADLDPLLTWMPGSAPAGMGGKGPAKAAGFFGYGEDDFYRIAPEVGAQSINAALASPAPFSTDDLAEAFAGLCDRAGEHGLAVHLEFLPWTSVATLQAALAVVESADRPNGGVMFDSWHHFRAGQGPDELSAAPGERVIAVQLNDAPREPEANLLEETLRRRLLPGEGDIDLVGLVRALDAIGCRAPLGVEVYSDRLAAMPPAEAGRLAGEATRAIVARARGAE